MTAHRCWVRTSLRWHRVLLGLSLLLAGCASSPPAHFYVLTPVAQPGAAPAKDLILGVGPIHLPAYLDQPQMVKRVTPNRVDLEELERWGGPLQQEVVRVLAQNLSELLGTTRVVSYPWDNVVPVDLQLTAEIRRFDPGPDGQVHLDLVWSILDGDGRHLLYMTRSSLAVPVADGDFDAIVQAQSQALAELSQVMARELVRARGRTPNR